MPTRPELDIRISVTPDLEEVESRLLAAAGEAENIIGVLEASQAVIQRGIERAFQTETSPSGTPWREWSSTAGASGRSYMQQVEIWTGEGMHSGRKLDAPGIPQADTPALEERATSEYAFFISYDSVYFLWDAMPPYAGIQNFGGVAGKGATIPARPFVGVSFDDAATIDALFDSWLERVTGTAAGRYNIRGAGGRFVSVRGL